MGSPAAGEGFEYPDHQDCPILRRDIDDCGKLVVANNDGKVICSAAGNSHRNSTFECQTDNASQIRFSSMDLPLKSIDVLSPKVGDVCRSEHGLYVYNAGGWVNQAGR